MPINLVPEFETDEGQQEEVVEPTQEAPATETSEPSAEEEPEQQAESPELVAQDDEKEKELEGLRNEKVKLIQEVQALRGQKRDLKKEELITVSKQIDDLEGIHPDDQTLIEKVLRAKGYMTKAEAEKMSYDSVKNQKLNDFLSKYPEYKPENDPQDVNWNTLQREFGLYRLPDDPNKLTEILERAHRAISSGQDRTLEVKKQQLRTASVGSSGVQRSTPTKAFDAEKRVMLRNGGFSDEDIAKMESRL